MSQRLFREKISRNLAAQGLVIPYRHDLIERKLIKAMGIDRYGEYADICKQRHIGDPSFKLRSLYSFFSTRKEAHLLFSHQSETMVECFAWMAENLLSFVDETKKVAEVGCATGLLCGALCKMSEFYGVAFSGFDREENFIKMARDAGNPIEYITWDYSCEAAPLNGFDVVMANLAIDFNSSVRRYQEIGISSLRGVGAYNALKAECTRALDNWRKLSKDRGVLLTTLRLPGLVEFLALADAASEAGWLIDLDRLEWIEADGDRIPAMVFHAGEPCTLEESELASAWLADSISIGKGGVYENDVACSLYRLLAPKEIIKQAKQDYLDGNVMISEVARCGHYALLFAEATTGFSRLEFHPIHKLERLEPRFVWED